MKLWNSDEYLTRVLTLQVVNKLSAEKEINTLAVRPRQ